MLLELSPNLSTASSASPSASSGAAASSTRQRWRSSFAIWKSIPAGYASACALGCRQTLGVWLRPAGHAVTHRPGARGNRVPLDALEHVRHTRQHAVGE